MANKKIKGRVLTLICLIALFCLLFLFFFSGGNFELIKSIFTDDLSREEIKERLAALGVRGYITIIILSALQVVFAFLPAEPVQVLAGIAFGLPLGLLLCSIGVVLGSSAIYVLYKVYGNKLREYFVSNLQFNFDSAAKSKKAVLIIFILYFLPAIPYGMICFFAASLGMKYPRFITITTLGAIPSVIIGVGLGHIAITSSWITSVIIFVILIFLIVLLYLKKDFIFKKVNEYAARSDTSTRITVKAYKPSRLFLPMVIAKIIFFIRGVKVKYTNKLNEKMQTPCVVLCNHGAFIDFAYAGTLLRKNSPNFIVARLYFYKKWLSLLLTHFGCFPKSMFAADMESMRNSFKVLKEGGVLAMMPEARLSTVGKFEDIQEGTYAFIKKMGVSVYTVKISGDYLSSPKWGDGIRRGSLIEAELDILFNAEEVKSMQIEQIKEFVEKRLYYNEFEWLKERPNVKYKSKTLSKGLENILSKCPNCKEKYTIKTKCRDVFCEKCGMTATIDSRYAFIDSYPFVNFADWYEWQSEEIKKEIVSSENYVLSSNVELKMRSLDGKAFLRSAGFGICSLNKNALTYTGTKDGEQVNLTFPISSIYRLLFGAGEDFEVYVGKEIYYFVPEIKKSAIDWYIASKIIYDLTQSNS